MSAVRPLAKPRVRPNDELLATGRVGALKDGAVRLRLDLAGQAKLGGQLADPFAGRLTWLVVVVLPAFGDGGEPVPGVAALNLRDPDHAEGVRSGSAAPPEIGEPMFGVHNVSAVGGGGTAGRFELGQLPYLSAGKARSGMRRHSSNRGGSVSSGSVTSADELRAGRV